MVLHYSMDHGQPESSAAAGRFRREKRLEESIQHRLGHAGPRVGDAKSDAQPFVKRRMTLRKLDRYIDRLDDDLEFATSFSHGLHGIGAQVHHDLVKLSRIAHDV